MSMIRLIKKALSTLTRLIFEVLICSFNEYKFSYLEINFKNGDNLKFIKPLKPYEQLLGKSTRKIDFTK
jgi:hypothetical protein